MTKFKFSVVAAVAALALALSVGSASAAYVHTTTLKMGTTNSQVMALQQTLNMTACKVATSGVGSAGMESMYFGSKTKAAVQCFQMANGLTADGVVGAMTGAKLAGVTVSGGSNLPAGCTSTSGYSPVNGAKCDGSSTGSTGSSASLSGETSISNLDVNDANDTSLRESASKAEVAEVKFDVDDAAAQLSRADVIFTADSGNDETKPWNVFDKVYLLDASGKTIASMSTDSKSDWQELTASNQYRVRFSGLNQVYAVGNDAEFHVAVDVASSVDGADSGDADWSVYVSSDATGGSGSSLSGISTSSGLRFTDGAGVDTQIGSSQSADFSIEQSGASSQLTVTESDNSPSATSLEVKSTTTSTQTVGIFNVKADSDGQDVKLNDFPIHLASATALNTFVSDVYIVVDGKTYTTDTSVGSSTGQDFYFSDLEDNDVVVDAGDDMDITVKVKFKSQGTNTSNYSNGTTITASTILSDSDVEDASTGDDVNDVNGDATADTFTLYSEGISVVLTGGLTPTVTNNDSGLNTQLTYNLTFKVTSFGDTVYIPKTTYQGSSAAVGLAYTVEDSNGSTAGKTASASALQSSAQTSGSRFKVSEGATETFTVSITVPDDSTNGYFHVQLGTVGFGLTNSDTATAYTLSPDTDFDTSDGLLNA